MWPACFRILSTRMVFLALPVCGMPAWAADGFAPPPRSISDVLAALDQYKPDPIAAEKARQYA